MHCTGFLLASPGIEDLSIPEDRGGICASMFSSAVTNVPEVVYEQAAVIEVRVAPLGIAGW